MAEAPEERSPEPPPHGHPVRFLLLLFVLGAAVHVLLPQVTSLSRSFEVLRGWAWWATALAAAAQASSYAGSGYLLQTAARLFGGRLALREAVMVAMASSSLGLLWGGQITTAGAAFRWLRQRGLPTEGALLAGWLPALVNVFTMSAVSVFGLAYLLALHELPRGLAVAFVGAVALLVLLGGGALLGLRHRAALTRVLHGAARLEAWVRRRPYRPAPVDAAVGRLFAAAGELRRGGWRGPLAGDLLNVGFDMLTLFLLFVAAGHAVSPGLLLAGYGLPLLLGKLSSLPGGVGVVEGSMAALYGVPGVPPAVTVLVVLGYRLLSFWVPISLGFPLAFVLDHERR